MEVPFSFLSGPNSSKVVTGLKIESRGGKKKELSIYMQLIMYFAFWYTIFTSQKTKSPDSM